MDWATVITSISAIGVVEGSFRIIDKIRFKKEERKEKKESVEQTAVATDRQQIDLGDLFLEKTQKWAKIIEESSMKMMNMMNENNAKRSEEIKQIYSTLSEVRKDLVDVKHEQSLLREFLNGAYGKFLKDKGEK